MMGYMEREMAEKFGVTLKSVKRYNYRGRIYEHGNDYAVPRDLRNHLVGSGYFMDTLIDEPEPQPIASQAPPAPPPQAELVPPPAPPAPEPPAAESPVAVEKADAEDEVEVVETTKKPLKPKRKRKPSPKAVEV
jgi:hypothetical protein